LEFVQDLPSDSVLHTPDKKFVTGRRFLSSDGAPAHANDRSSEEEIAFRGCPGPYTSISLRVASSDAPRKRGAPALVATFDLDLKRRRDVGPLHGEFTSRPLHARTLRAGPPPKRALTNVFA
jgi:hypothetical protein